MAIAVAALTGCSQKEIYKDPSQSVERRVEDLLSRMTLEEKVGQMNQFVGIEHIKANSTVLTEEDLKTNTAQAFYPNTTVEDVENWTKQGLIGSFLHVLTLKEANYLQQLAMQSRLQIPIIFGIDAIHGNANAPDNTVYPTNINLACSFDTAMAYKIARQTAKEMRAMNMHWTFNPNVEVARDPRWGRVGETFGEDPYLVMLMGEKTTLGYQGNLYNVATGKTGLGSSAGITNEDVLACAKHFVGGSEPINGTNGSPADLSERTLREVFFPSFKRNIVGLDGTKNTDGLSGGHGVGALSVMMSHNELNGVPCHTNEWLMTDILRKEWGFKGFVVSDWMDIEHVYDLHRTAENLKEAFYQTIIAGMDMHMHGIYWNEMVVELVKEGRISEKRIDESVRRILTVKFALGLFEQPFADESESMKIRLNNEHRATALESARNGIVLLKNTAASASSTPLLPLEAGKYKRIFVTGINADNENIMGDWSSQQKDENVITILEGIKQIAPEGTQIDYVEQGWDPRNMPQEKVDEAVDKARNADLNIVVAGEYMMRFRWTERTDGEDTDRSDIDLVGLQNDLIKKIIASGKPTVVILIHGRPLGVEYAAENATALIDAFAPGMYGGQAIAEILYGKVNPSAKLAVTIPRSVGQLQMIYNHKPSQYFHPYAVKPSTPLYPFGYGLSYTTYEYSDLKANVDKNGKGTVEVTVKNTGSRDGVEVAQMYIRDVVSSVTRPVKELKGFARIPLKAGESRTVTMDVTPEKLGCYDLKMKWGVERGEYEIMLGGSSLDKDLLKTTVVVE